MRNNNGERKNQQLFFKVYVSKGIEVLGEIKGWRDRGRREEHKRPSPHSVGRKLMPQEL